MIRKTPILMTMIALSGSLFAQMAPRDTASAYVGGKKISIEYGRPSLNGRSVADLTSKLPADRIWRAGSEQITTLQTAAAVTIGGKSVPAGKYSVYLHCPESGDYSLVLNKVLGQPLIDIYDKAPDNLAQEPWPHFDYSNEIATKEVARVPLARGTADQAADMLTFSFQAAGKGSTLRVAWGDQHWSADVQSAKMAEGSH